MSRFVWGALALIAACLTTSARAADLYGSRAPLTVSRAQLGPDSWAGPYLGGATSAMPGVRSPIIRPSRPVSWAAFRPVIIGGRDMGVRYRRRHPGDRAEDTFAPWKFSNPWFGTVRGPRRFRVNNVLFFGTGGLAFGELRATTFVVTESHTNAAGRSASAPRWNSPRTGAPRSNTLCRSGQQQLRHYRGVEWLPVRLDTGRR